MSRQIKSFDANSVASPLLPALRGPVVRLAANDPVWIATVKRALATWPSSHSTPPRLDETSAWNGLGGPSQKPVAKLFLIEVGRDDLLRVAEYLASKSHASPWRAVALLKRCGPDALVTPEVDLESHLLAKTILHEAGASLVIASARQFSQVIRLAESFFARYDPVFVDPLDELPFPCWAPGWQTG